MGCIARSFEYTVGRSRSATKSQNTNLRRNFPSRVSFSHSFSLCILFRFASLHSASCNFEIKF